MKQKRHAWVIVLMVGVLVSEEHVVSAAQRPMTVAELALYQISDRQKILEEGARKEGKLVLYTTGVLKGAVLPVISLFEKKYPYIKVEVWRAGGTEVAARIHEEYKAGKRAADVFEAGKIAQLTLRELGITQPFYSPNLANIDEGAITKARTGGFYSAAFRLIDLGIGYNTKLLTKDELPKTYQDLLNPKWKGKVPIGASSSGIEWMATMLEAHGREFVKKVAQQNFAVHAVSAAALLDMIISGEYPFSPTIYCPQVKQRKKNGAPVDWAHLEPVYVSSTEIALIKNSPHPHAAMLYLDHQFSKECADIQKASDYISTLKDASVANTYRKFYGARSVSEVKEWDKLFGELFLKKDH